MERRETELMDWLALAHRLGSICLETRNRICFRCLYSGAGSGGDSGRRLGRALAAEVENGNPRSISGVHVGRGDRRPEVATGAPPEEGPLGEGRARPGEGLLTPGGPGTPLSFPFV